MPRSTAERDAAGGGQLFGQSPPAIARRMRWPGSKVHAVASSSSVDPSPARRAPSGSGRGRRPSRCVRFRIPRVTSADVPSGNTSHSFAARYATGAVGRERQSHAEWPSDLQLARRSASRSVSDTRVVGALIERLAPRQPARARDPRGRADVAAHRELVRDPSPVGRSVEPREPVRRPRRLGAPLAAHLRQVGLGTRRAARRRPDRRLLVDRRSARRAANAEPADHLRHEVDVRAGERRGRDMWLHGPASSRFGQLQRLERAEGVVAIAVGPAGDDHRRARDAVVVRAGSEPWRQYGPSRCSSSQRSTHGSVPSMRRSHSSRQPSPYTAGHRRKRVARDHVRAPSRRGRRP